MVEIRLLEYYFSKFKLISFVPQTICYFCGACSYLNILSTYSCCLVVNPMIITVPSSKSWVLSNKNSTLLMKIKLKQFFFCKLLERPEKSVFACKGILKWFLLDQISIWGQFHPSLHHLRHIKNICLEAVNITFLSRTSYRVNENCHLRHFSSTNSSAIFFPFFYILFFFYALEKQ